MVWMDMTLLLPTIQQLSDVCPYGVLRGSKAYSTLAHHVMGSVTYNSRHQNRSVTRKRCRANAATATVAIKIENATTTSAEP